jgi:transposase
MESPPEAPAPRIGRQPEEPAELEETALPPANKSVGNLILNAVRSIDPNQLQPVAAANAGVAFQPRALLALLAYCYAVGILSSQDIEQAMEEDQLFRLLCSDEFPNWHVIRRFRRLNRETLRQCLEQIAAAALSASMDSGRRILPVKMLSQLQTSHADGAGLTAATLSERVEHLIEQAVWLDSMDLDG